MFTSKWTTEEIEIVKAGGVPASRSDNAVKLMRLRLGLAKYKVPKWTKEHKAELVRLHMAGMPTREIAKILPYTQRSIQKEIVRLKLPHKTACRFTKKEKAVFNQFLQENWQKNTPNDLVALWNQSHDRKVNERKIIVYLKKLGLKIPRDEVIKITLLKKHEKKAKEAGDFDSIKARRMRIMQERVEKGRDIWTGMPQGDQS